MLVCVETTMQCCVQMSRCLIACGAVAASVSFENRWKSECDLDFDLQVFLRVMNASQARCESKTLKNPILYDAARRCNDDR